MKVHTELLMLMLSLLDKLVAASREVRRKLIAAVRGLDVILCQLNFHVKMDLMTQNLNFVMTYVT